MLWAEFSLPVLRGVTARPRRAVPWVNDASTRRNGAIR